MPCLRRAPPRSPARTTAPIVERPARNLHDTERVQPLGIALPARLAITQHARRLVVVLELQVRVHQIEVYRLELRRRRSYLFPGAGRILVLAERVLGLTERVEHPGTSGATA